MQRQRGPQAKPATDRHAQIARAIDPPRRVGSSRGGRRLPTLPRRLRDWRGAAVAAAAALAGCAPFPQMSTAPALPQPPIEAASGDEAVKPAPQEFAGANITHLEAAQPRDNGAALKKTLRARNSAIMPQDIDRLVADEPVDIALPPQSLPEFIDSVFGVILEIPYATGPDIAARKEIVSLRSDPDMSKRKFLGLVQAALLDFGLIIAREGNGVRIVSDSVLLENTPIFLRSRALPETPTGSRPILQFFELKSIDVNSLVQILKDSFPKTDQVKFTPQQLTNTLIISGNRTDVAAALQVIRSIDQPSFAHAQVARIQPVFWSADELTRTLIQTLQAEGYQADMARGGIRRAVLFMPIQFANQILVFSNQREVFDRALYWAGQLDQPAALGDDESVFIYVVQNTDAKTLAEVVANAGSGAGGYQQAPLGPQGGQTAPAVPSPGIVEQGGAGVANFGHITVDVAGNRILFRGTPNEFQRLRDLLLQLDTPPLQVLIEVTIAEVTLTDVSRFGFEWFLRNSFKDGQVSFGSLGGLGLAGGGFTLDATRNQLQLAFNAFASNNKINILSTPRIVARSGGTARIQVGTDIPVITSQRAVETQTGAAGTDVLQTIEFRQTGVILTITPIVYGGDRINLEIDQEVSDQAASPNAAIASPSISNRTISTELSLREGMTAVLGGLIQDDYTRGSTGVPFFKDIPALGQFFRSDTVEGSKTELYVFVTPYIIRSGEELAYAADYYSDALNQSLEASKRNYTLVPWTAGARGPRIEHRPLPFRKPSFSKPAAVRPPIADPQSEPRP